MYWYAAWSKPFHVDEFYSWVYAHRCSFYEIITMKDGGIGHPPFYHFLQKVVQTIFTGYHFLQVRLVNYIAATLYILTLAVIVYRFRKSYLLCFGVCLSASVFELFLFSRMYGVLALMALWTYCLVEKFIDTGKRKYAWLLFFVVITGFLSDYNFILMMPCVVISITWHNRYSRRIIIGCFIFLAALMLLASSFRIIHSGIHTIWRAMSLTASDIARELRGTVYLIMDFSFKELVAAGIIITLGTGLYSDLKKQMTGIFLRKNKIFSAAYQRSITFINNDERFIRLLLSLAGAYLLLLTINPIFSLWRDLIDKRFLFLLFPLVVFFLIKIFPLKLLRVLSVVWIVSGLLFLASNRVQDSYPPPALSGYENVVYYTEFSYSTRYLKIDYKANAEPELLNQRFASFCRVCTMGRLFNADESRKEIVVAGTADFPEIGIMPDNYILIKRNINISPLDELFFKYLTPIYTNRFGVFVYRLKHR